MIDLISIALSTILLDRAKITSLNSWYDGKQKTDMASTGLIGPRALTFGELDRVITRPSPGTYVLGTSSNGIFTVKYVGRSDNDLRVRLKDWVGQYREFKFGYFSTPKEAFDRECQIYHAFGGEAGILDNEIHPASPASSTWECPVSNCRNRKTLTIGRHQRYSL